MFFKAKLKIARQYVLAKLLVDFGAICSILREGFVKDKQIFTK